MNPKHRKRENRGFLKKGGIMAKKNEYLKEVFDKIWPQAKKEIDRVLRNRNK